MGKGTLPRVLNNQVPADGEYLFAALIIRLW